MVYVKLHTLGQLPFPKGWTDQHWMNVTDFVKRNGTDRALWNFTNLWAWVPLADADGPAMEVLFTEKALAEQEEWI